MTNVDFIIVGQGLAGSILAYKLIQEGKSVAIFNDTSRESASEIAIGLTNPITGKRLVKSWMIEELLESSLSFYSELEEQFQEQFIIPTKISRVIPNDDIFEQWQQNFLQAAEEGFIDENIKEFHHNGFTFQYFDILRSYWLQTKPLLQAIKLFLKEHTTYLEQHLDYTSIDFAEDKIIIDNFRADKIIFCEGAQGVKNPFTKHLPFNLNKGEIIRTKNIDGYNFDKILKKNIFIVPDNDTYRIGATYDRDFKTIEPTEKAIQYFNNKLSEIGVNSVEIIEHSAAIRPATIDRRPLIGKLEENMYIFNGFGAKGVSLAPYFADHFVNYLLNNTDLIQEVDVNRI